VEASRARYFGLARNAICEGPAESSPVGDVDARAREHRLLDDQVELLLLGDLVDDARGALLQARELLVAAQVEVLADLALQPLEVAADVGELALLLAARGLRHGDVLALQLLLQVAPLLLDLGQLHVARGELALEHLLGALGGGRLAEHALGIDEPDLHLGRAGGEGQARNCDCEDPLHGEPQNILPSWNWKRSILSPGFSLIGVPTEKRSGPTGESHVTAIPVDMRRSSPLIFSPGPHTLPTSKNRPSLTFFSL
jgi:hypothetical protein